MSMYKAVKKIIPNLFFLFVTSPVLSPFIGGITLYLSAVIIFFDLDFYDWIKTRISWLKIYEILFLIILIFIASRSLALVVKSLMLLISATYCYYCYLTNKFYLYRWVAFNIVIAVAQFALIFIDIGTAYLIGPANIANVLWGNFASPANSNFYSISILPRVSGLSREGGFFASLLAISFFILLYDRDQTKKRYYFILFSIGLTISMSKASLIVLAVPMIVGLRKYINISSILSATIIYCLVLTATCYYIDQNTNFFNDIENITFIHRFGGYLFAPYAQVKDFFTGVGLLELATSSGQAAADVRNYIDVAKLDFCGLPFLYLGYGIALFLVFILCLKTLNFNSSSVILVMILTANVSPLTSDGFVVLAWFLGFIISVNKTNIKPSYNYNIQL